MSQAAASTELTTIKGACPHDCPDTCGLVTEVQNGQAIRVTGDPENPITKGWLCAKVRPYLDHVYHPDRLLHPLRRVGPKGAGQWKRISWDEALDEIVTRWKEIIGRHGAQAILPYSYSGTLGLVQMIVCNARLWNRLGASRLERSICGAAAEMAVDATIGSRVSPPLEDVLHSRLVILWGHNPIATAPHFMPFLQEARRKGCRIIVIDPRKTATARTADWHLAPWPGTDGALALGIAHVLVREQMHDEKWLNAHSVGWPQLRERLREFPPDRVAARCGLSEADVVKLAELYGRSRPGLIKIADGINRNRNGGQNVRAVLSLPAITGQYGIKGGGLAYSTSGYFRWNEEAVQHWKNSAPPGRIVNMNRLGAALLEEITNPPIQSLYVYGANPVASSPNSTKTIAGLQRPDLFTIVHELFLTDTADYADIVLPATSQLEHVDLHKAYGHTMLTYNRPAIPPRGESRSNWDVMRALAARLGIEDQWLRQDADDVISEIIVATAVTNPAFRGISLDLLKKGNPVPLRLEEPVPFMNGHFPTPSGKIELYSKRLGAQGIDPLPGRFIDEPPPNGELHFVTGASHHFVSSSLANQDGLLAHAGEPLIEINPQDARSLHIADGDCVIVENERGACSLRAAVRDTVRPGLVASPKGRWAKRSGGRNVNWTTSDELADMAGQSTFHSNRVRIRRVEGPTSRLADGE
jgi:anaerobic selenocysteine-containing dehydrogenase